VHCVSPVQQLRPPEGDNPADVHVDGQLIRQIPSEHLVVPEQQLPLPGLPPGPVQIFAQPKLEQLPSAHIESPLQQFPSVWPVTGFHWMDPSGFFGTEPPSGIQHAPEDASTAQHELHCKPGPHADKPVQQAPDELGLPPSPAHAVEQAPALQTPSKGSSHNPGQQFPVIGLTEPEGVQLPVVMGAPPQDVLQ
jgi:hypothetical protein